PARPHRLWPLWVAAASAAVLLPLGLAAGLAPAAEVPQQVQDMWVPGQVTLVGVIDFDCSHCRRAAAAVGSVLKEADGPVHFVRLVVPMPVHKNARPAARAYLAAFVQGKADALAPALLAAGDLTPAGCRELAARAALDLAAFDRFVADPATD